LHHPNASKLESFCLPLKSLHPIAPQNASKIKGSLWHSKACTQLHNKMLQSSKLLFGTQKLAPNSNTKKKKLQSSKLLFGTQKLAPNSNTKCFKAQSFCLALKSFHPIIGNASKLQIQASSNFFKMRQDPEKKKKTPSKHHHQNTKKSPLSS
jgi:hypothetical protein